MNSSITPDQVWNIQKGKLKLRFMQLTDKDFIFDYGMKEVMLTRLQNKLGKSREDLNILLKELYDVSAIEPSEPTVTDPEK
jgi:hypothetical protein